MWHRNVASVVGSPIVAEDLIAKKPQLLVVDVRAKYTSLAAALGPYGVSP